MQGENMSEAAQQLETDESRNANQLPDPKGYKILIALPDPDSEYDGGIIKSKKTMQEEELGSICGMVLKMGPDCYKDPNRFPTGSFCKEGDWIIMRSYSGTRFKVHGKEFRLINDDSVEAVVEDPRGIVKA
jgi:co-chaperonin GroES (HSP10)|tara:strand:+ start:394 stop:786 length:393 start_codon:yes stop_codon:yes gene_type:complete